MIPLLRASHLQPTLAVTAIVSMLALRSGRGAGTVLVALAIVTGQLFVGWSNDWLDRDRDRAARRLDKPIAADQVPASLVGSCAVGAFGSCVAFSLANGWRAGLVHVGAVALAGLYNLRLKATPLSPLAYVVSFGSLPAFVTLGLPGHPWPAAWAMLGAALLGGGAHFVNTLPDQRDDRRQGMLGLPQRIGATASLVAGAVLLAAAAVVLALLPPGTANARTLGTLVLVLVVLAAVVVAARTGRERAAWTATIVAAVLAAGLLVANGASLA